MLNVGCSPAVSTRGLLSTPFYQRAGEPPVYALEGAVAVAGSLIQWLRDNLKLGDSAEEIAALAASVPSSEGVIFVPAFNGLFAPHWRSDARGVLCGLTAFHTGAHISQAALDASVYQAAEVLDAAALDTGVSLKELRVDGGMCVNDAFVTHLANILGVTVARPLSLESTALGVAQAAGLAVGVWPSLDSLAGLWKADRRFFGEGMSSEHRTELKRDWAKAVDRAIGWVDTPVDREV